MHTHKNKIFQVCNWLTVGWKSKHSPEVTAERTDSAFCSIFLRFVGSTLLSFIRSTGRDETVVTQWSSCRALTKDWHATDAVQAVVAQQPLADPAVCCHRKQSLHPLVSSQGDLLLDPLQLPHRAHVFIVAFTAQTRFRHGMTMDSR